MRKILLLGTFVLLAVAVILSCGGGSSSGSSAAPTDGTDTVDRTLLTTSMVNEAAYIPPQCYTKTEGQNGKLYNPCYSCHRNSVVPNYMNDEDLQAEFTFPEYANTNHWTNLFTDRSAQVAAISDAAILNYVRTDNYKDEGGNIILAQKLAAVPAEWDYDADGTWDGYVPDCYFSFDSEGFDRTPEGGYTGWRAYGYAPFLGTFWPANGSTDDVLIRLDSRFRNNAQGQFDINVYKLNLAIVESLIKRTDVAIDPVNETLYGVDLDKNGSLATANMIKYEWAPLDGKYMSYVGQAKTALENGAVHLAGGLFPEKTDFLHSVRYIDVDGDGNVSMAKRMKELRYARKNSWNTYSELEMAAYEEIKEDHDFPDRLTEYIGNIEKGISNSQGWTLQAFIEAADGSLRPQTYEETVFCMGCHGRIGATSDSMFTFSRKYDSTSFQKGWFHWTQKGLKGIPEHKIDFDAKGVQYEYSMYLAQNGAGDEFRENSEITAKFFNGDGTLKQDMITALHGDVSVLLFPSAARALTLDKAYKTIVERQSYVYGRDASVLPVENVHKTIEPDDKPTGITDIIYSYAASLIF